MCELKGKRVFSTDRFLLGVELPILNVHIWDPKSPDHTFKFDFRDWKPVHHSDALVVARRGSECLFWNFDLGTGVRTDCPWMPFASAYLRHGVILLLSSGRPYIIPLPHISRDASYPMCVPEDVPLAEAREAYLKDMGMSTPASISTSSQLPLVVVYRGGLYRCM